MAILLWMIPTGINCMGIFPASYTVLSGKIVYVGVAFMPTIALHFAINYLGSDAWPNAKKHLGIAYSITILFVVLLWTTDQFITGYYQYWWGNFPKTGILHYFHTAFVLVTAIYIICLFRSAVITVEANHGRIKKYYEYKFLYLSFLFVIFASVDFLPNWGIDVFPVGCLFVLIFVLITSYGILKHQILGISFVVKKSLVYSTLVSCIAAFYFLLVYLVSIFLGSFAKAQSAPVILPILIAITFLFKPLENRIRSAVDRIFYKKSIETMDSENRRLKEEIAKQDRLRAVATLAAGMAHEIKNPLTSIKTFAEHLPKKYDDPDFREKFSRIVVDEVDRVNNIVKQLLEFSKPSSPDLKPVLIGDLLDQTLGLINNNMVRHHIELTKELDMFSMVSGDRNQLRQAFLNLFLNAIQSMTNGGKLHVSAHSEHGGKTRISISDTGCGMTPEQAQHAFDPFFTTKEDGTGLGLAIVHSIITKHGGKIEIKSKVGEGTTVSVFLKSLD